MGIVGIFIGIALVIFLVYRGLSTLVAAPIGAFVVMLFNAMPLRETMETGFFPGAAGFVSIMFGVYITGMVLGVLYTQSGAAKSIALGLNRLVSKGQPDKKLNPLVTIFIIYIVGMVLDYGGLDVAALVLVLMPLGMALMRQSDIPIKMAPGLIMGCTCTAGLTAPGSPQIPNILSMNFLGTSPMAAAIPGFIGAIIGLGLNIIYINWETKKEKQKAQLSGPADVAINLEKELSAENLPHPIIALIPLIVIFLLFNLANMYIVYAIAIGLIVGFILFRNNYGGLKELLPLLNQGCVNACVVLLLGASMSGFGTVLSTAPGFMPISTAVSNFQGAPLFVVLLTTLVCTGVTGSTPAGLGVMYPMFGDSFLAMGAPAAGIHRVAAFAAATLDTLPYNALYLTLTNISGYKVRETYKYVGICTVLNTFIAALVVTIICTLAPSLAV